MSDISFGGLATGLPTEDIVSSLMAVEQAPLDRLQAKKDSETERLQAFGQLRDKLEALRGAVGDLNITSEVRTSKIDLPADAPFSASSQGARTGSYDIAVAQLAQVQKSVGTGVASTTESLLGNGTLTFGGTVINIGESNNSLGGIVDAINLRAETTGVRASIINDGDSANPYRLVLTGDTATTSFEPIFDLQDAEGQNIDFSMDEVRSAQQAVVYVDGTKVLSNSNTLTGVVSGVTLTLHEVSEQLTAGISEDGVDPSEWAVPPTYQGSSMTVAPDTEALKEKITTFVDSYNGVMEWIASGYVEFGGGATDGDDKSLSEVLRGNSTVNSTKRQLQSILGSATGIDGSLQTLGQLGIATNRDGTISLNSAKLDQSLASNFEDFTSLLAGEGDVDGVMKKFNTTLLQMTSSVDGIYASKQKSYDMAMNRFDTDIDRMKLLMDKKEKSIRAQYNAMELLVSGMNSQSDFLTQQIDLLNNMMTGNK